MLENLKKTCQNESLLTEEFEKFRTEEMDLKSWQKLNDIIGKLIRTIVK